jgi:hypothetical protein
MNNEHLKKKLSVIKKIIIRIDLFSDRLLLKLLLSKLYDYIIERLNKKIVS